MTRGKATAEIAEIAEKLSFCALCAICVCSSGFAQAAGSVIAVEQESKW